MKKSPIIVGTLLGAAVGAFLFTPIVITNRTTVRDAWMQFVAGLLCAGLGLLVGLLIDFRRTALPVEDQKDRISD